jgi:hypothetical protein
MVQEFVNRYLVIPTPLPNMSHELHLVRLLYIMQNRRIVVQNVTRTIMRVTNTCTLTNILSVSHVMSKAFLFCVQATLFSTLIRLERAHGRLVSLMLRSR